MNSDNFLLEEYDIEQAKDICKSIDIDSVRQRAVANALAGAIAIKYFSPELEIDIESGLYNIPQVLDNYEISDVYIKNNYIDVRLYFNENDLCVPKSHYENDLQPVAYMFIKLDEDISGATVTGFIPADAIDTSVSYDGYYRVNESELMSFCDIDSLLTEVYESECPDDINRRIFAFLEGDNESVVDFYRLLINSREARLRLKKAAKADLVFNYVSTVKTPEEFSSNGETNDDNTTVIIGESNDVEELLSLDGPIVNLENDELEFVDGSEPFLENDAISLDNLQEDMENVDFLESSESLELGSEVTDFESELVEDIPIMSSDILSFDDSNEFDFSTETTPSLSSYDEGDNLALENDSEEVIEIGFVEDSESLNMDDEEAETSDIIEEFVSQEEFVYAEASNEDSEMIEDGQNSPDDNISPLFDDEKDLNSEEDVVETADVDNGEVVLDEIADYNPANVEVYEQIDVQEETFYADDNAIDETNIDNNYIETLFNQESEPVDSENNIIEEPMYVQPKRKSLLPTLGLVAVLLGVGYFGYNKFATQQSSMSTETIVNTLVSEEQVDASDDESASETQDAMPIESIENNTPVSISNEGLSVSIPAIEKNLDASILVSNLKINWEVPLAYTSNSTAKRYLTKLGKIIQLNLKSELLLLSKVPISNKIALELEFDKATSRFKIKSMTVSSGETSIDTVIKQTVEKALEYNLSVGTSSFATLQGNPVLVIHL